jgi:hypothetical protein
MADEERREAKKPNRINAAAITSWNEGELRQQIIRQRCRRGHSRDVRQHKRPNQPKDRRWRVQKRFARRLRL